MAFKPTILTQTSNGVAWQNSTPPSELIIDNPSGVQIGDCILIVCSVDNTENATVQFDETYKPTGFTLITQSPFATAPDVRVGAFFKIADGTEGATFTIPLRTDISTNHGAAALCFRLSGVDPLNPINLVGTYTSGNYSPITTTEKNTLAMFIGGGDGADTITGDTATFSVSGDFTIRGVAVSDIADGGTGTGLVVGTRDMASIGTTPDLTITIGSNDGWSGVIFSINGDGDYSIATQDYLTRVTADSGSVRDVTDLENRNYTLLDKETFSLVPSGVKTSKVYAQLPTDGTGDITLSRASIGTYKDENGFIRTALTDVPRVDTEKGLLVEDSATNKALHSSDFTNTTSWAYNYVLPVFCIFFKFS
jgi:hypothetical protein